jgi:adenine deaminase
MSISCQPTAYFLSPQSGGVALTDIATKMVALYAVHADLVGRLNRAGVPILAGSDSPNPYVYPGFSLHDELGLLVRSGLTPAEALRTATINPATFLGVTDSLGTVATGKVADLVLLDANPLGDIANTKRIRAVIQGGRLLNRSALDAMLAHAKARAAVDPPHDDRDDSGAERPGFNVKRGTADRRDSVTRSARGSASTGRSPDRGRTQRQNRTADWRRVAIGRWDPG